jgi:two-component system, cell cycle sensor histidine kinase and response regulator CckA
LCKDGSRRVWDCHATPLGALPDGRRVVLDLAADVTDRRHSEERIIHLNRVLRAIRDINQLIVHERDRDALIREVCRLLVEQRSYNSSMIILTDAGDRPHSWAEEGMGGRKAALDTMLGRGELPPCCAAARQAGGPCLVSDQGVSCAGCDASEDLERTGILCTRLRGGDGTAHGYLVVTLEGDLGQDEEERGLFAEMAGDLAFALSSMDDRAARLRAEEDREDIQRQLLQAQKMEAVGQLAGGIAHDFNNILQALMGYTQMLLDEAAERGEPHEELKEIFKGTERAAALTRQLLAFSRRQVMRPEVLDLNAVIENILKMLRRVIGEHIRLEWIPGIRLGSVHADAGMLEQVLMNLCVNARDAMDAGGTLTIETMNVLIDSEYCESHAWATPGRFILLSVTDTGCGMDAGTLERMFEPFYTTKTEGKGTGLGLATVYGIIKQHEGNIIAYSEPGKGTTFKVYLPVCESQADVVGTLVEGVAGGGTETILLAEDDPNVRKLAKRILERAGYTVICAVDGPEAVMLFKEHADTIDLLLLDVVMPGLGGQEVLDRIRALRPDIPALFSSGYSENGIHTGFVLKAGLRLIQKPYRPSVLLRALREILDGQK